MKIMTAALAAIIAALFFTGCEDTPKPEIISVDASQLSGYSHGYNLPSNDSSWPHMIIITGGEVREIPRFYNNYVILDLSRCTNTSLGRASSSESDHLMGIILPSNLVTLEASVLEGTQIKSISIPASVTTIGNNAFKDCKFLTGVNIPARVTSIGSGAFSGCTSLAGFTVDETNAFYQSDIDGVLYNKEKTSIVQYPAGRSGGYTIPAGVVSFGSAFQGSAGLTSISIPEGITSIGASAFSNCSALISTNIPASVTTIGSSAFSGCTALKSVTFAPGTDISSYSSFPDSAFPPDFSYNSLANAYFNTSTPKFGTYIYDGASWTRQADYNWSSITWQAVTNSSFPTDNTGTINSVAWGNDKFVAVGTYGRMAWSLNGTSWTAVTDSTFPTTSAAIIRDIVWGNDKFVAVGASGMAAYSTDGLNWTGVDIYHQALPSNGIIHSVTYGNGVFVVINMDGGVAYSADGIIWEAGNNLYPNITGDTEITFGNNRFVASGSNGRMAYSDNNGQTWIYVVNSSFPTNGTGYINSLSHGNGKFVAGGYADGAGRIAYSLDGVTWTTVEESDYRTYGVRDIAFGGTNFIAVGDQGKIESSADGIIWKPVVDSTFPADITGTINGAAWDGTRFVVVGSNGKIACSW